MTDSSALYRDVKKSFASHEQVNHSENEYVRGNVHTNTVEGYFGILKRGLTGIYQHVSRHHLHRYLDEFAFRYNSRKITDGERSILAVINSGGKRLMYKNSLAGA